MRRQLPEDFESDILPVNRDAWPPSLKSAFAVVLAMPNPSAIWWGANRIQLYNHAFGKFLETIKIAGAFGQPANFDTIGINAKDVARALQSSDSFTKDVKLPDGCFTFSFTVIIHENHENEGLLLTVSKVEVLQDIDGNPIVESGDNRAKKQIEESEMRLLSVIESAPFPIGVYLGREMIISSANQAIRKIIGKGDNIIGKSYFEVLKELEGSGVFESLINVYESGEPYHAKNSRVDILVDDKVRSSYFNYSFMPLRAEDGSIYGVVNTGADVTELMLANKRTEENEKQFRNLIEESPVATCMLTGPDFIITIANAIMLSRWNQSDAIIGRPLLEAIPELEGQPFIPQLRHAYQTGESYSQRAAMLMRRINGRLERQFIDYHYKPLRNAEGEVYAILAMSIDVTESVLAEEKNREIQRKLLASFEQSPVGIAIIERDQLTFTMANKFYCEMVGRKLDDLINKPLLEALPEIKGQGFDELLQQVLDTGKAYTANEVFVELMRDGRLQPFYVDLAYQPQFNDEGMAVSVLVVATDVSLQVFSRQAVEDREAKLASVIKTASAGIALFTGPEMRIEIANDIMLGYWGKNYQVLGKPFLEAVPEMKGQPFPDLLEEVYQTGQKFAACMPAQLDLGEGLKSYYFDFAYNPLFNADGEVYGVVKVVQDITKTVISNQKIHEAENRLRAAIEQAQLATWRFEFDTQTFHFSERFVDWTGFENTTMPMAKAFEVLPAETRAAVEQAILEVTKPGGDGIYEGVHTLTHLQTGHQRIIHAQAQVELDVNGTAINLIGTARDITQEQKQKDQLKLEVQKATEELRIRNLELADANKSLRESNAELAQFAYVASHDLQEPVRKISFFSEMLQSRLTDLDEKSAANLEKIRTSADRMGNLIRDILGFSQLSKDSVRFSKVDLNKILKETIQDFDLIIAEKQAVIEVDKLPVIDAIPPQMTQLFGNLISNSLKYSRAGVAPRIEIRCQELEEQDGEPGVFVRLTLSDNGIGFDAKYATQIFNIFQRLHGKLDYQGTGIGLAMCKKIVHNHNGVISASGVEGKGAQFIVTLPKHQPKSK